MKDKAKAKDDGSNLRTALVTVGDAVLGAAVMVLIGVWAGGFLDQKLNTGPWLSLTLSIVGGGLGLWRMVKKAMQLDTGPVPKTATPQTYDESGDDDQQG